MDKIKYEDKAAENFEGGYNCSQSVLAAMCEELGLEREMALKAACGFGGGMGRQQETCGALSGAIMLIGLKYGKVLPDDNTAKEKTYTLVYELAERFREKHGSTLCRDLLGVDLLTGEKEEISLKIKKVCPALVRSAVDLARQIFDL